MSTKYLLRLLVWAAIVTVLGWLLATWVTAGFPRPTPRVMTPAPPSTSVLDTFVNRPAEFARENWLYLIELAALLALGWGVLGKSFGVYDLIYPGHRGHRFLSGLAYGLAIGNLLFTAYITGPEVVPWAVNDVWTLYPVWGDGPHAGEAAEVRTAGHFLLVTWPATLLLLYVPTWFDPWTTPHACRQPAFGAGLITSVLLTVAAVVVGWLTISNDLIGDNWRHFYAVTPGAELRHTSADAYPLHLLATAGTAVPFLLLIGFGAAALLGRGGSPVWVICLVIWFSNAALGFITYHFAGLQYVLAILLTALWLVSNARHPYKLSFPNLDAETMAARRRSADRVALKDSTEPAASPVPLLSAEDLLARFCTDWQRQHGTGTKPKLVVVATSGGGIRAAVWTAAVLEGLDRHVGGADPLAVGTFGRHVRLITGASGGMVAAGLYAAHRVHPARGQSLTHMLAEDSLWATMQSLVLADLPAAFVPFHRQWDRARSLEASWHANTPPADPHGKSPFRTTFAELLPAERDGLAPSLLYCPVLVEDGRRLLISNLELGTLATEMAATLTTMPDGTPAAVAEAISRPAVEMFKLFPAAHARFEVGTAARMSATFPFVSPGVSLPTFPPRRVVDAGYFDNYGVNLASLWLYRNRAAVRKYCGGVAVVEVRAFPLEAEKRGVGVLAGAEDAFTSALSGVSTPAEALATVQSAGAYYRNDQLLGILNDELNTPGEVPFFVRVGFECEGNAALSWALTTWDRDHIINSFDSCRTDLAGGVCHAVRGLHRWFGTGGG